MTPGRFRLLGTGKTLKINTIAVLARCTDDADYQVVATPPLPPFPLAGRTRGPSLRSAGLVESSALQH